MDSLNAGRASATSGYAQFQGSETLSDVTIRYGHQGERIFHGHKVILAGASDWFRAAFTGGFQEGDRKEITLHEDDPKALEVILKAAYNALTDCEPIYDTLKQIAKNDTEVDTENVFQAALFCLDLYEVADKYGMSTIVLRLRSHFRTFIYRYTIALNSEQASAQMPQVHAETLAKIVDRVYELESTPGQESLRLSLILSSLEKGGVLGVHSRSLEQAQKVVTEVAKSHAAYGRDLFMYLMDRGEEKSTIGVCEVSFTFKVKCPRCNKEWFPSREMDWKGHCWGCGLLVNDWDEYTVDA